MGSAFLKKWLGDEVDRLKSIRSKILVFAAGCLLASFFAIPKVLLSDVPQETEAQFISQDAAHLMFATDQVLHGMTPYRDFFWHYGLAPLYAFAGFCKLFGAPSPSVYNLHNQLFAILIAGLTLLFMVRVGGLFIGTTAWFLTGLGWAIGEPNVVVFTYYERFLVISVAFLWIPPEERRPWTSLVLGLLLGALQTVKFGGAFLTGASWVLCDVLWMVGARCGYPFLLVWARQMIVVLVAFLVVESAIVVHAVTTLGPSLAWDTVFPVYMLEWYRSYLEHAPLADRWPTWVNTGYFAGYQLPQILGLAGVGTAIFCMVSRTRSSPGRPLDMLKCWIPAALLGILFLIGFCFYFKHIHNIVRYKWLIPPAVAVLLRAFACTPVRILFLIALLPSASLLPLNMWRDFRSIRAAPVRNLEAFQMPNGQKLRLDPEEGRPIVTVLHRLHEIQTDASATHHKGFVILGGWIGSGLHYYGSLDLACRHSLFYAGHIRDFESEQLLDQLLRARAVVVHVTPKEYASLARSKPEDWKVGLSALRLFRDPALTSRFLNCVSVPEVYPNGWLIFPVRSIPSQGPPNI